MDPNMAARWHQLDVALNHLGDQLARLAKVQNLYYPSPIHFGHLQSFTNREVLE